MAVPLAGGVTKPHWEHLEFCWKLENFWELRALGSIEALEDDNGDVIWSQQFGDKRRGIWRLKLYPYGDSSPGGKGHVSLFLSLDTKSIAAQKAYAIFGCYILDASNKKIQGAGRSFTRQKFAEGSSSWGWSQFVKVVDLNLQSVLVNNEMLSIKCEVEVFTGVKTQTGSSVAAPLDLSRELVAALESPHMLDTIIEFNPTSNSEIRRHPPEQAPEQAPLNSNSTLLAARCRVFNWLLKDLRERSFASIRTASVNTPRCKELGDKLLPDGQGHVYENSERLNLSTEAGGPDRASTRRDVGLMTEHLEQRPRKDVEDRVEDLRQAVKLTDLPSHQPCSEKHSDPNVTSVETFPAGDVQALAAGSDGSASKPKSNQPRFLDSFRLSVASPSNRYHLNILSPEIKPAAVESLLTYCLTDKCAILSGEDSDLVAILQLLVAAVHFSCDSVIAACSQALMMKLISKRNATLVLDVAQAMNLLPLVEACQTFFEYCGEMSGTELLRVLEPPGHHFDNPGPSVAPPNGAVISGSSSANALSQSKASSRGASPPSTRSTASSSMI